MEVVRQSILPMALLDCIARQVLGAATSGVSVGGGATRIHLLQSDAASQQCAAALLDNFGGLPLTASPATLRQGDADARISCRDAAIADDAELGYALLLEDEIVEQGRCEVRGGEALLLVSAAVAGVYTVCFYRQRGSFASGTAQLAVNPL